MLALILFFGLGDVRVLGQVHKPLDEVSGLAAAAAGHLWAHNDSGDGPNLYALSLTGELLATFVLSGRDFVDVEDMAAGPGPEPERRYLFLADVGNNRAHDGEPRASVIIYRFPEPALPANSSGPIANTSSDALVLLYPDHAHDVETLLVDPLSGDLYLCTKRDPQSRIYRLPKPGKGSSRYTLELVGEMKLTGNTAGDVSPDGRTILIKTYPGIAIFSRDSEQPLWKALVDGKPVPFAGYRLEPQGEAIAFDLEGKGFYTLSEARGVRKVPLYYYSFP